jgi:hypothetical protein
MAKKIQTTHVSQSFAARMIKVFRCADLNENLEQIELHPAVGTVDRRQAMDSISNGIVAQALNLGMRKGR